MMNVNKMKVFGVAVMLIGIGGGWIGQRLANRKYEKKVKECQEELEKTRKDFGYEMDRIKADVRAEMASEAKSVISNALDGQAKAGIWDQVSERANKIDMDAMAKDVVSQHMTAAADRACNELKKDAQNELSNVVNELSDEAHDKIEEKVTELIENKIDDWVEREMYHVNSRRIIEDCVDRAVREEIGDTVRSKLKLLNVDNFKAFLL